MTTVNIISVKNFNQREKELLQQSVTLIEQVINSDVFRDRVLKFSYNGKNVFNNNRGLSNEQILKLLLSGKEEYNNRIDNVLDFILEISTACPKGVIGTTYNGKRTETYRCKINEMNEAEYAGHLIHEYCHYLGFSHSKKYNKTRQYTVPYAIGYLVRDLSTVIVLNISTTQTKNLLKSFNKPIKKISNVKSKKTGMPKTV